ncbi:thioredoxin family protein [Yeosuana marina]|uniref:thioredoxin family protein n=1 Tax=Yeosuana marina TaxID=1565536 RepID=UPI0030C86CFA
MKKVNNSSLKLAQTKSNPFWRWFWLTFLVGSLAYAWYSFYVPSNDIAWANHITSTEMLTNNSNKNTLLFFTGKWCVPCRIMKREVFADNEVMKVVNSKVIPVMIDIDNQHSKGLVKQYKIGTTPTIVIVDSQGNVIDYAVGKIGKRKFLEMVNNLNTNK